MNELSIDIVRKIMELRERGYGYHRIAKELGISVYKVYRIAKGFKSTRDSLIDMESRVSSLEERVREIDENLVDLYNSVDELSKAVKDVGEKLSEIAKRINEISHRISVLESSTKLIEYSSLYRAGCRYIDKDGYCMLWHWNNRIEGYDMRIGVVGGKTVYYINVRKHGLICTACPSYEPMESKISKDIEELKNVVKGIKESLEGLRNDIEKLKSRAELLEDVEKLRNLAVEKMTKCRYFSAELIGFCSLIEENVYSNPYICLMCWRYSRRL